MSGLINDAALQLPKPGDIVMLTFEREGRTISLAVVTSEATFEVGTMISFNGPVKGANFLVGIDQRLDSQRRSIERLLGHLQYHCAALAGKGVLACDYATEGTIKRG